VGSHPVSLHLSAQIRADLVSSFLDSIVSTSGQFGWPAPFVAANHGQQLGAHDCRARCSRLFIAAR